MYITPLHHRSHAMHSHDPEKFNSNHSVEMSSVLQTYQAKLVGLMVNENASQVPNANAEIVRQQKTNANTRHCTSSNHLDCPG